MNKPTEETRNPSLGEEENVRHTKTGVKKALRPLVMTAICAVVIFFLILFEKRRGEIAPFETVAPLLQRNGVFTFAAFFCFFIIVFSDAVVFCTLTGKIGKKQKGKTCLFLSFEGRYFDRITPWSMGGQPFQIMTLKKKGLTYAESGSVITSRHIIRFFSTAFFVILFFSFSRVEGNAYVIAAALISLAIGLTLPFLMLLCAFKPKIGQKIVGSVIHFFAKIKWIKREETVKKKAELAVEQFAGGVRFLSANKFTALIVLLASVVELFANGSVPYFTMRALGVTEIQYWETFIKCLYVNYSASFAPTPGASGVSEVSFYAVFEDKLSGGFLFWAVMLWRTATFYLPVFIGFVLQTISSIREWIRLRKEGKKG